MADDIIRVWLWNQDGSAAGEFIPAPGQPRPHLIVINAGVYVQDPRNADRYLRE